MSASYSWRPTPTEPESAGDVSTELWRILAEDQHWMSVEGIHEITVTTAELAFLNGVRVMAAGLLKAEVERLQQEIRKYGSIDIYRD